MRVAAITMVYKDSWALKKWLSYYGKQLGDKNLFVILHGDDTENIRLTNNVNICYVPRHNTPINFDVKKAKLLSLYGEMLLDIYDAVITTDVDEIVAVDPALNLTLPEYIESKTEGFDVISALGLEIHPNLLLEEPFDDKKNILEQRRHVMCLPDYCKPSITKNSN